ncbi:MAG: bis(5'-nucleosyl)-tetraphosphatase [Eubacteriales bacterium]
MKHEKSCGAVIFRKTHGKYAVLLIKNRFAEFWSFPKGHVEDGENEYQTAIREVKEETGIDIKIENGFRMESVYLIGKKKNTEKKAVYFASLTTRAYVEPQFNEISAFRWFYEDEFPYDCSFENDRLIFDEALKFIKTRFGEASEKRL